MAEPERVDSSAAGAAYFLTTRRLRFRCWGPADLPLARELWGDPRVTRLVAAFGPPSEQQTRARLAEEIANQEAFGVQYWPVFLLDGGHVGCCGLRPYRTAEGVFELGAHLRPAYWGQGYATEAVRAVMSHAFGPLRVRGLFARHNPDNHASGRLLTRLGFRHTRDDFMPQTGLHHPAFELSADDWRVANG